MHGDIERVLITQQQIAARVAELATQILADHEADATSPDSELTIVPILTGAMIFCADLIRQIPIPMRIAIFTVNSYPGKSVVSQGLEIISPQLPDVRGRRVLLVDDILDSGTT